MRKFPHRLVPATCVVAALAAVPACSLKTMAVKTVANTLADTGDVFTRDDDPELIRDAHPVCAQAVRVAARVGADSRAAARSRRAAASRSTGMRFSKPRPTASTPVAAPRRPALRERALKHYLRGRGYCLRAHRRALRQGHAARRCSRIQWRLSPRPTQGRCAAAVLDGGILGRGDLARHRSPGSGRRLPHRPRAGRSRAGARSGVEPAARFTS